MYTAVITGLRTLNQLLTAGIAITAFSLLLYALTFNLRDRVARSFALILACVVVAFVGDALGSVSDRSQELEFWLRLQWVGIVFLPATYLQFSDAVLATTGKPSRGRRRAAVRLNYLAALAFLASLPFSILVGPLVENVEPAPHLQRTWLSWVFTAYYAAVMALAGINLLRASRRTVARVSRRRMGYLLAGALSPALGSYPYLLFGSGFAEQHTLIFWLAATLSNLAVSVLLVLMAYAVAFFGVPWPDRVVKRRLFKWLMRGPVTASVVLAVTTLVRRAGEMVGLAYSAAVPVLMVVSVLVLEHLITLVAPLWERWLFHGGDRNDIELLQKLEERLLTTGDLRQFLEAVLAAACDRLQSTTAFIADLGPQGVQMMVTVGNQNLLDMEELSDEFIEEVSRNGIQNGLFLWRDFWLVPLFEQQEEDDKALIGLLGIYQQGHPVIDAEQTEALSILARRAATALTDRRTQQRVFSSLEALTPQVEMIQRLRAAAHYESGASLTEVLTNPNLPVEQKKFSRWVKDALTHYWGGPKLTSSPLLGLSVVQEALTDHQGNPTNALRSILKQAIEQTRPEGERRFTAEWILYNILEMKFVEGRKVREVALRLAMSEADLYRKQRVAIEAVATAILEMEEATKERSLALEVN